MQKQSENSQLLILQQMLNDAQSESLDRIKEQSLTKPTTDDELYAWIRDVLGFKIARHPTDPTHQSPFQFIADAFFDRYPTLLAQGPRGGGKTLNYAIFELATMIFKPGIWIVSVAGSEGQAKDGYKYLSGNAEKDGVQGLIFSSYFKHFVSQEPRVTQTVLNNKSRIEIRTGGSEKSVSGPHPQVLIVDELDHIDPKPLSTAMGMAQSTDKYPSITMMASSQYHSTGTMQILLNSAEKRNIKVYKFDLFDIMESCGRHYPDQCEGCPLFDWTNPYTNKREEMCKGRGERSDGHYKYRDALKKYHEVLSVESFALQYLLLSGGAHGMAYSQYGSYNQKEFDFSEHSRKDLERWRAFAGIDQRGRGRIVVILESPDLLENDKHLRWAVAEWASDNNTPSKLIAACKKIKQQVLDEFGVPISAFWSEGAAGDLIKDFPNHMNARAIPKDTRNIAYGVGMVRDMFIDNMDVVSLKIDTKRCPRLHQAIDEKYKCKKLPDGNFDRDAFGKEGSDFADALRYACVGGSNYRAGIPMQGTEIDDDSVNRNSRMKSAISSLSNRIGGRWSPY